MDLKKVHYRDLEYMLEAHRIANKSDMRSKHGSVIVKNGKIISYGHNRSLGVNKHHYREGKGKGRGVYSIHAEQDALMNVDPKKLNGATLYVIRMGYEVNNTLFMDSRPCHKCMSKIRKCMEKHGLKKVYFSLNFEKEMGIHHQQQQF